MCRRGAVVINSETTDLHGSTCELHAVLVMTSSIRQLRALSGVVEPGSGTGSLLIFTSV
jgi:hypothetical protein